MILNFVLFLIDPGHSYKEEALSQVSVAREALAGQAR